MDVRHRRTHPNHGLLSRRHVPRGGGNLRTPVSVAIYDHGVAGHGFIGLAVVGYLGIDVQVGRSLQRVDGGGVDVGPRRAQVAIQRIGLVYGIGDVQHHVAVEPAEIRIEGLAEGEFRVVVAFDLHVGVIVHPHGQHVIRTEVRTFLVMSIPHGATPLS